MPAEGRTRTLLASSDGVRWPTPLDGASVQGLAFARALLTATRRARR